MSERLLLPVSALPGLSLVGLRVACVPVAGRWPAHEHALVVGVTEGTPRLLHLVGGGKKYTVYSSPAEIWNLDFGDGSTRDRVARWVGRRMDMSPLSTAPGWRGRIGHAPRSPVWWLVDVSEESRQFGPNVSADLQVEALSTLDPSDAALLPDGSRFIDARALLLVAQHLGRQP